MLSKNKRNNKLAGLFGLHASLTLGEEKHWSNCREAAPSEVGFHIHAAEHQSDQFDSIEKSGDRVIDGCINMVSWEQDHCCACCAC